MKKMFQQYFKTIGTALVGLAFGFAFFYLFLNFYHYQEIRRTAYFDATTDTSYLQINEILSNVEASINILEQSNQPGNMSAIEFISMKNRLKSCVQSFKSDEFIKLKDKKQITIVDAYNLYNSYENEVLNGCVVSKLTDLLADKNNNDSEYQKILRYYRDDLLQDTSYLKKDLLNNSTYHFSTDSTSVTVKSEVRDGFYEVLSAYNRAAKFLEIVSDYYASSVGGAR